MDDMPKLHAGKKGTSAVGTGVHHLTKHSAG